MLATCQRIRSDTSSTVHQISVPSAENLLMYTQYAKHDLLFHNNLNGIFYLCKWLRRFFSLPPINIVADSTIFPLTTFVAKRFAKSAFDLTSRKSWSVRFISHVRTTSQVRRQRWVLGLFTSLTFSTSERISQSGCSTSGSRRLCFYVTAEASLVTGIQWPTRSISTIACEVHRYVDSRVLSPWYTPR